MLSLVSSAKRLHYRYDEYLRSLEQSELKLEYCDGVIYAMAGGTPAHAELSAAVIAILHRVLPKNCRVATSDLKIRVEASDLSTFPDASVVCGEREVATIDSNAVTNPSIVVEVTSRSTEDYDRGDKLSHYKQIPSLRTILFVSHTARRITTVSREGARWTERDFRGGERVIVSISDPIEFDVDEVYDGITLDSAAGA
jgi:Uma2 family endonuclease